MAHDLSFNKAEIDLHQLIDTTGKAVKDTRWLWEILQSRMYKELLRVDINSAHYSAHNFAEVVKDYAELLDLYNVLIECLEREELVIIKENEK